jgi:hypothetical protein
VLKFGAQSCFRGISSTVRRCIEKETGKAYAAKIIDLSNDGGEGISAKEATKQEVAILRHVAGHHYISKCNNQVRFRRTSRARSRIAGRV